ncbi:MAG: hypothetical protein F6K36_26165 [Symploca sp. SIO3C6]|uniref:Uncharacterized protein n=1 Tax=Symploca sp. SIO1C4 TaxID=2607765 RepID=A0A6B3NDK3_9CYAN|nr:hypothetical protein [Symploca sp. SIO3C6]NER27711.1 hypothetical protein [Symploca sp. SIO1C4]
MNDSSFNVYYPPHPQGFPIQFTAYGVKHQANKIIITSLKKHLEKTVYGARIFNNGYVKLSTKPKHYVGSMIDGIYYSASTVNRLEVVQKVVHGAGHYYVISNYTILEGSVKLA